MVAAHDLDGREDVGTVKRCGHVKGQGASPDARDVTKAVILQSSVGQLRDRDGSSVDVAKVLMHTVTWDAASHFRSPRVSGLPVLIQRTASPLQPVLAQTRQADPRRECCARAPKSCPMHFPRRPSPATGSDTRLFLCQHRSSYRESSRLGKSPG